MIAHRVRKLALPVLICTAAALVSGSLRPAKSEATTGQVLLLINSDHPPPKTVRQIARRYRYVVLQVWDKADLRAVRAGNRHAIVLAYQNLSAMARGTRVNGMTSSGVGFDEANSAHPNWFLRDAAGNRITESGWPWLYMADIGNAGYQRRWAANVIHKLRSGPFDGVFMDDTNTTAKYHVDPSRIAAYPNDRAYQRAVRSMLAYVGPRLRAAGDITIANMGAWVEHPGVVKNWLRFVSGGMDEMFAKWSATPGVGYRDSAQWKIQLDEVRTAGAMGKVFLAITQAAAGDRQAQLFGWASMALGARSKAAFAATSSYGAPPAPIPQAARIGRARGPARAAGGLVYRTFTRGIVVVNPGTQSTTLNLASPLRLGARTVSSAVVAPHSAMVLRRARTTSPLRLRLP